MKGHIATIHEGKKKFKCDICSSKFTSKQSMNIHIAVIHEGKKQFKCDICNAEFTSKHGMKGHIATIHEGKKQTIKTQVKTWNEGKGKKLIR